MRPSVRNEARIVAPLSLTGWALGEKEMRVRVNTVARLILKTGDPHTGRQSNSTPRNPCNPYRLCKNGMRASGAEKSFRTGRPAVLSSRLRPLPVFVPKTANSVVTIPDGVQDVVEDDVRKPAGAAMFPCSPEPQQPKERAMRTAGDEGREDHHCESVLNTDPARSSFVEYFIEISHSENLLEGSFLKRFVRPTKT